MMQEIHFVAASDVEARLGVTMLNDALPGNNLNVTEVDAPNALRVLVDVPPAFALHSLNAVDRVTASRTLVLTGNPSIIYEDVLRYSGVAGVIRFRDDPAVTAFRVREALAGKRWGGKQEVLTKNEARLLRWLLLGFTGAEVAARCRVSQKTVNAHVSNILRSTGLPDRAVLIASALTGGPA